MQSFSIVLAQAAKSKKYVFITLLAGNLFSSTIDKSYIAASYNFDLHVFLFVPSKQFNAKLTGPIGYVKRFSTLMQELVSNDDLIFLVCLFAF